MAVTLNGTSWPDKKLENQVIKELWRLNGADMTAVLDHREPHVLLSACEFLSALKKDVVLRPHDYQAPLVHLCAPRIALTSRKNGL